MIRKFISFISGFLDSDKDYEQYRDEFESEVNSLDEFKGVKFTRSSNGDYVNEQLQDHWVTWRGNRKTIDYAI